MCGIVGYIGSEKAAPFLLDGLEKLEYRGYDSAGIATLENQKISFKKTTKRITMLKSELKNSDDFGGKIGIGHTRWATHGAPTEQNAHPHLSFGGRFAVVHNGIIENYLELKKELEADGVVFKSETDTEVVAHLLEKNFSGDTLLAISKTVAVLKGACALLILTLESASSLYAVCKFSPLVIGVGEQCNLLASDYSALARHTTSVINMHNNEIAVISKSRVQLFSFDLQPVKREPSEINYQPDTAEKGEYEHFMMKEIKEQPVALKKTILSALKDKTVVFEGLKLTTDMIKNIKRIVIVACGSAYHAGVANKYIFEELLRLPVEVDLASEFRYRHSVLDKNVLVIAVSQSGETADTLAALIKAKKSGTHTLAVVNVVGSSISKAADDVIYTKAGSEIAVATTKAYSAQLVALYLLAIYFAKVLESASESYLLNLLSEIALLPDKIEEVFKLETCIKELAKDYHSAQSIFFIGRNINYATAMEGSLKLKEISYLKSESYAAGELKHGSISLIENGTVVIALSTREDLSEKMLSNIKEVKARGGFVIAISDGNNKDLSLVVDRVLYLPKTHPLLLASVEIIPLQLFAYYVALFNGCDIDKPRNLAKSVTVE